MISNSVSKKALCLSLLLCGYQAGTICKPSMDYILGTAVATTALSALGWAYTYYKLRTERQKLIDHKIQSNEYRKRFSDHELIDDINTFVNDARINSPICLGIYATSDSLDTKREMIARTLTTMFTSKTYDSYAKSLTTNLAKLRKDKNELEAAKARFQGDVSKELLLPQIDPLLRKFTDLIPMLEIACEELLYALCLKFSVETHELYSAEHELAAALGDPREIKFRLEQAVNPFVAQGNRYPYCAYYAQLTTTHNHLKWLTDKMIGFNPRPSQKALVTEINHRYKEVAALCAYVNNCQEMIIEQRHAEIERRLLEEARIAEQRRKWAEQRLLEEARRIEQRRFKPERKAAAPKTAPAQNQPKPSAPPLNDLPNYYSPPAPGSHSSEASAPSLKDLQ